MGRAILDPDGAPRFTDEELARLDAMTPDDIERNAREDAENPPLTDEEVGRLRALATAARQEPVSDLHPQDGHRDQAGRHAHGKRLVGTTG